MLQISKVRPDFHSTFQLLSALTRLLLLRSTSNFEIIPELFLSFQRYQNCRENLTEKKSCEVAAYDSVYTICFVRYWARRVLFVFLVQRAH